MQTRLWHVASLASLRPGTFVATLPAVESQHSIVVRPDYRPLYVWQRKVPRRLVANEIDSLLSDLEVAAPQRLREVYVAVLTPAGLAEEVAMRGDLVGKSDDLWVIRLGRPFARPAGRGP